MKRESRISLGPGAPSLILIFVVLSMSALGMLALMTARNDLHLSERSAEVAEIIYGLNERAEDSRRTVDELLAAATQETGSEEEALRLLAERLPEGLHLENRQISWTETEGERILECALSVQFGENTPYTAWSQHRLITELNSGEEDLWD